MIWLLALAALLAVGGWAAWAQLGQHGAPQQWTYRVVAAFPHDPRAFTQGLTVHDGELFEGTGQRGASSLRQVDLKTGRVQRSRPLDARYFGEGIAILDGKVYQLTWQSGVAFAYDLETFELLETFRYEGEGWGLTEDGEQLIMSDGSATIRFIDPDAFAVTRTIMVRDGDRSIDRLNELEFIDGEIWANVWYDDRIVRIDPQTGAVLGWLDLGMLYPRSARPADDVLNGIAYDKEAGRLFVTGKNWPQLFELALERP